MMRNITSTRALDNISSDDVDRFRIYTTYLGSKPPKLNVLIFGDLMIDFFMRCKLAGKRTTNRHSFGCDFDLVYDINYDSEFPENHLLGGAARIAFLFKSFANVSMLGIIGNDCQGKVLKDFAEDKGIDTHLIEVQNYLTITKYYIDNIRYSESKQDDPYEQLKAFRVNRELPMEKANKLILGTDRNKIFQKLITLVPNIDCIIIKDNEKGLFAGDLSLIIDFLNVQKEHRKKTDHPLYIFLDPKYDLEKFNGLQIDGVLPNIKETATGIYTSIDMDLITKYTRRELQFSDDDYEKFLKKFDKIENFIIKADREGAKLIQKNANSEGNEYELVSIDVYDSKIPSTGNEIGCGDAFDTYYIGLFLLRGIISKELKIEISSEECLRYANFVAGIQFKKGPHTATRIENVFSELELLESSMHTPPKITQIPIGYSKIRNVVHPIVIGLVQLAYDPDMATLEYPLACQIINPDLQWKKIEGAINLAKNQKINILCFPEISFIERFIEPLLKILDNTDIIVICGSYFFKQQNICTIIHNGRKIAEYKKINPSIPEKTGYHGMGIRGGDQIYIFDTKFGKFSVLTCSDYPNNLQYLKNKDRSNQVNFVINPCYDDKKENLLNTIKIAEAAALEHKIHTVIINRAEINKKYGCSGIVGISHHDYQYNPVMQEDAIESNSKNPLAGEINSERIIVGDFYWQTSAVYSTDSTQPPLFDKIRYYEFDNETGIWKLDTNPKKVEKDK